MNSLLKKLQPAEFKGFRFLAESESVSETGRRKVIHDFPNTDRRYVQDLGVFQSTYVVPAVISGENYLRDAEQFERVLSSQGAGKLILPHIGVVAEAVALPYSIDYSQKSVGVIRFSLSFTISNTTEVPSPVSTGVENVYQAGDNCRKYIQTGFQDTYKIPKAETDYLKAFNDTRRSVVNTVEKYQARIDTLNSRIQKTVRDLQSDLVSLIVNPQELAKRLIYGNIALADGLFATFSSLFSGEDAGSDFVKPSHEIALRLTDFGSDFIDDGATADDTGIPQWDNDTGDRQDRNVNRMLIVETSRINGLIIGYETAANFDYETLGEIESAINDLENAYAKIMLTVSPNSIFPLDNQFKLLIDYLKSQSYAVLAQKAQAVFSVGLFNIQGVQSVMNLSYKLYAERLSTPEDLQNIAESMVALNPNQTPISFSGEINIYEVSGASDTV